MARKTKKTKKARRAAGPRITATEGRTKLKMRCRTEELARQTRSIGVEGAIYQRGRDGNFLVNREHVAAVARQGLVRA